jgi:Putative zinc-finger
MSDTPPPAPLAPGAPMSCAEARPYLSAYVDGELAEPVRSRVARHLAGCAECAARAESYRATDALLASLPETAPAPEVFHAVMAAAREQNAEPVERETLVAPFAGLAARRLRVVRPEPQQDEVPAGRTRMRKKSWVATAMPAVAALLLVTLAALAFRGLVMAPPDASHASTPTPTLTILEKTQAEVTAVTRTATLPFRPVLPTYAPTGATSVEVSLGYASDNKTVISLDIVWHVTSSAFLRKVQIRESANGYEYPGYLRDTSDNAMSWQLLDKLSWQPLKNQHPEQITTTSFYPAVAAGQHRDDNDNALYIAVEATGTSPSASRNSLVNTLRQVTLSMDREQKLIPLTSLQTAGLILHYRAQSQVTSGATPAWSIEVYVDPATDTQRVEVGTNEVERYVDVSQGSQQGYRWDPQTRAYATGPRSQFSGNMNPTATHNDNVLQIFSGPGTLLQNGYLWYSGTTKIGSASAFDYILVSAPNRTDVYIDQRTNQVVKVQVDPKAPWNAPPAADTTQVFGQDSCSYFTLIEYLQPEDVADKFSLTPPKDSHQGNVPATVKCS